MTINRDIYLNRLLEARHDGYEKPWMNKEGITFIGIIDFLLDPKSIETL